METHSMKMYTKSPTSLLRFLGASALGIVMIGALYLPLNSGAQATAEDADQRTVEIAKRLCGEDGRIAKCVGLAPHSCVEVTKPLLEECLKGKLKEPREGMSPEEVFESCFWSHYIDRYGSRIQYTDECFGSSEGKSPLEPLPPHLEEQMKPLNPPDKRKPSNSGELGF